eukprot:5606274-Alexandrium_andersonii.AAC.1
MRTHAHAHAHARTHTRAHANATPPKPPHPRTRGGWLDHLAAAGLLRHPLQRWPRAFRLRSTNP